MLHGFNYHNKQSLQRIVSVVTEAICRRSRNARSAYLNRTQLEAGSKRRRADLPTIGIVYHEDAFFQENHGASSLYSFVNHLLCKGFLVFLKKISEVGNWASYYKRIWSNLDVDVLLFVGKTDQIFFYQLRAALKVGNLPVFFLPSSFFCSNALCAATGKNRIGAELTAGVPLSWLLLEVFGLLPPGTAFLPIPYAVQSSTRSTMLRLLRQVAQSASSQAWISRMMTVENLVNGMVTLLAIGGSAYSAQYVLKIAEEAGWLVTWDDLDRLSKVVPVLTRLDAQNARTSKAFQQAGGIPVLLYQLAIGGLLHMNSHSIFGALTDRLLEPVKWADQCCAAVEEVGIKSVDHPLSPCSGFRLLHGNLGRACAEVSWIAKKNRVVIAPALVCHSKAMLESICFSDAINQDTIIVLAHATQVNTISQCIMDKLQILQTKGLRLGLIVGPNYRLVGSTVPTVVQLPQSVLVPNGLNRVETGDMLVLDLLEGRVDNLVNRQEDYALHVIPSESHPHRSLSVQEIHASAQVVPAINLRDAVEAIAGRTYGMIKKTAGARKYERFPEIWLTYNACLH